MKPVALILDPAFGQGVEQIALEMPAWVISSPLNDAAVDEARRKFSNAVNLTSFIPQGADDKAASAQALYDIEEHHGPCTSLRPYDELRVFGAGPADLPSRVVAELGWVRAEVCGNVLVLRKQAKVRAAGR